MILTVVDCVENISSPAKNTVGIVLTCVCVCICSVQWSAVQMSACCSGDTHGSQHYNGGDGNSGSCMRQPSATTANLNTAVTCLQCFWGWPPFLAYALWDFTSPDRADTPQILNPLKTFIPPHVKQQLFLCLPSLLCKAVWNLLKSN